MISHILFYTGIFMIWLYLLIIFANIIQYTFNKTRLYHVPIVPDFCQTLAGILFVSSVIALIMGI